MAYDGYKKLYLDDDIILTIKGSSFNQTILNQYVNYSVEKYVKTQVETSPTAANWTTVFEGRAFFADKYSDLKVDINPFVEDNIEYRNLETANDSLKLINGKWTGYYLNVPSTKGSNNFTAWRLKATIGSKTVYSSIVEVLPFYHYSHINYKWNIPNDEIIGLFDDRIKKLNIVMQGYDNTLYAKGIDERQAVLLPHYPYNVVNLPVHIQVQMNQNMSSYDANKNNGYFCIIDEYGICAIPQTESEDESEDYYEMPGFILKNSFGLISQGVNLNILRTETLEDSNYRYRVEPYADTATYKRGYHYSLKQIKPNKPSKHFQLAFFHKDFYNQQNNELYLRPILEFDTCPADYYVMWRDRYNSMNCQPVLNNVRMSNNYSRVNKTNSKGEQKIVSVETSSSWVVNTDWLTHEKYYVWESILVSPEIYLIDTKNEYTYRVIITDNIYNEKTRDNNNKMFNLTLNLKNDHTKTITY